MSAADSDDDPSFATLSARLRHRIDDAFDSTVSQWQQSGSPGGFIPEEPEAGPSQPAYEAGGFILEDVPANTVGAHSSIPLADIPRALSLLDLCPDDDLMRVFENAAAGWGGARSACNGGINRRDWRAICAALLEGEHDDGSDEENPAVDADVEMGSNSSPDSDGYQTEELSGDTGEGSGSEYAEQGQSAKRTKREHNVGQRSLVGSKTARQLSESQKAQCRRDFGRFFPRVIDGELDQQRLMIKDIVRVADLLKETLKADEILEMLEAFSSSPDKSMSLADFEHMMMATKLV